MSGDSTVNTDPPYFSIAAQQNWHTLGTTLIANIPNIANPAHNLNRETVPFREDAAYHNSEGDVVRSAALYLLHPVNQALSSAQGVVIRCQSELTANKIRSDITYFRAPTAANPNYKAFAVVEFKKRGVIKDNEFRSTIKYNTVPNPQQLATATAAALNHVSGKESQFDGDAWILIKQAASYAINHRTPYVALFDWDFLALVHFTKMVVPPPPAAPNAPVPLPADVGDYCELEIIPNAQSQRMRGALLGFLGHAFENAPAV
jgi:hypothetical protein